MNAVRKKIMNLIPPCKDFIAFSVGGEYLNYDAETNTAIETDFEELIVVVEKNWLFDYMKADGIKNPRNYLENTYTWDDSIDWFWEAVKQKKIVSYNFN